MRHVIVLGITVCLVAVGASLVRGEVVTLDGTVKAVDAKKRTISVETGSKTLTLDVSSKAKVTSEGKDTELASLKPGQRVTLSYHKDLEIVLKIEASSFEPASGDPMIDLFDGKTLKGWKGLDSDEVQGWAAESGEIVTTPGEGTRLLLTDQKFDDFELRCDFWLDKKANSGVFLRGRYELQLVDDGSYPKFTPDQRSGAIYGQLAPRKFAYRGPRRWNSLSVRLERKTVTVVLNGVTVIDHRYIPKVTRASVDDLEDQPGPIALQRHTSQVKFRNLKIRRLNR